MYHNHVPTVVFLLSVSFLKLGGIVGRNFSLYEFVYHDTLWITEVAQFETEIGLRRQRSDLLNPKFGSQKSALL